MDVTDAARRWADELRRSWPAGDVEAFVALYAENAPFRGPFGPTELAVDHMRFALSLGAPGPQVWVGEPVVSGDRAAVEWWAVVVVDDGPVSYAGTAWLRFDAEGSVVEENDYWHSKPGGFEPWPDWGN